MEVASRIRVFIGTEPKTEIARKVLECSIQRRTDTPVDFIPMIGKEWEYPTNGFHFGTGFSLRRWMIPAYCGWDGLAIYLDADQLVLADIKELWDAPRLQPSTHGTSIWCSYQPDRFSSTPWPQSSVMLIDCAAAKGEWGWNLETTLNFLRGKPDRRDYAAFMHMCERDKQGLRYWTRQPPKRISSDWNGLDTYTRDQTKLIHYTAEDKQPWFNPDHPLTAPWERELIYALHSGMVTDREVLDAVAAWTASPVKGRRYGMHPYYKAFVDPRRLEKVQLKKVNKPKSAERGLSNAGKPVG